MPVEKREAQGWFFQPSCAWCSGGVVPGSMHKHLKNWGENSEIGSLASLLCVGNGNGMLCRGIPVRVVPLSLRNPLAPPPNNRYRVLTWRLRNCLWRDRDIFKGC